MIATLAGLNIVQSPLAMRRWVEYKVEPWPIRKRRRSWRVRRHERSEPGCYRTGDTLIMHPVLFAQFKQAAQEGGDV